MNLSIEKRVNRLELWNKVLMIFLFGSVLLMTTKACVSDTSQQTLHCEKLEVVDTDGKVIAMVGVDPDGSRGLFIYDEQERMRVFTIHDSTQSVYYAMDEAGAIRVGLAQYAHGGGGLALHGPESKGGAVVYYKNGGSISFYDREGKTTLRIPEKK